MEDGKAMQEIKNAELRSKTNTASAKKPASSLEAEEGAGDEENRRPSLSTKRKKERGGAGRREKHGGAPKTATYPKRTHEPSPPKPGGNPTT